MTTKKYSDLSINEILKLDGGDQDQDELAAGWRGG
jgi:hypothetical protein